MIFSFKTQGAIPYFSAVLCDVRLFDIYCMSFKIMSCLKNLAESSFWKSSVSLNLLKSAVTIFIIFIFALNTVEINFTTLTIDCFMFLFYLSTKICVTPSTRKNGCFTCILISTKTVQFLTSSTYFSIKRILPEYLPILVERKI